MRRATAGEARVTVLPEFQRRNWTCAAGLPIPRRTMMGERCMAPCARRHARPRPARSASTPTAGSNCASARASHGEARRSCSLAEEQLRLIGEPSASDALARKTRARVRSRARLLDPAGACAHATQRRLESQPRDLARMVRVGATAHGDYCGAARRAHAPNAGSEAICVRLV